MPKIKVNLMNYFLMALVLAFFPEDNRLVIFGVNGSDWYGKLEFNKANSKVILLKNSSNENVFVVENEIETHLTRRIYDNEAEAHYKNHSKPIPPKSYSLLETKNKRVNREISDLELSDGRRFKSRNLSVLTPSDRFSELTFLVLLAVTLFWLGLEISPFFSDKNDKTINE